MTTLLAAALVLGAATGTANAQTKTVNLRVLIVSGGQQAATDGSGGCINIPDPGRDLMEQTLQQMLVPYDVYDANANNLIRNGAVIGSPSSLTADLLAPGSTPTAWTSTGNYNGIILTDSQATGLTGAGSCGTEQELDATEWKALDDYASHFAVRQSVISGWLWPWGRDYGMDPASQGTSVGAVTASWASPAGGKQFFEYIRNGNPLTLDFGFAYTGKPRLVGSVPTATTPSVQPLLRIGADNNQTLTSIVRYAAEPTSVPPRPYVREVLVSSIVNAPYLIYSQKLAYEFVNFATKGVFAGGRYAYLLVHNDDLFNPTGLWDPTLKATREDDAGSYRITDADFNNVVTAQRNLLGKYAALSGFALDLAFNGYGTTTTYGGVLPANPPDALTTALVSNVSGPNDFRYLNHTYQHRDMDFSANSGTDTVNPSGAVIATAGCYDWQQSGSVPNTTYTTEITNNRSVWQKLGLAQRTQNNVALISGEHSGLKDDGCALDPTSVISPPIPYPNGRNGGFLSAAYAAGIRYLASDASQPNQGVEQHDASGILLLPRRPANIFFNVTAPGSPASPELGNLVDEFNWIFHDRFTAQGLDPCGIPGAICSPVQNLQDILFNPIYGEVQSGLRHILSYREWPFYFHQSNLMNYDGGGKTLQFDWLDAVVGEYDKVFKPTLKSPRFFQVGADAANRVKARTATIDGYATLDASGNPTSVSIRASSGAPVTIPMTGISLPSGNVALYGGQSIQTVTLTTTLQTFAVNRAL